MIFGKKTRGLQAPERLESREMMATQIFLDFDGASAADIQALDRAAPVNTDLRNFRGVLSYVGEFATLQTEYGGYDKFRFLDFDGNGRLTSADGDLAAQRIMERVRQDFAPYNAQISRIDSTSTAIDRMKLNLDKDATVVLSGHHTYAGGQAPLDINNAEDNGMAVDGSVGIARWVRNLRLSDVDARDAFVNFTANAISQEAGHSFGLSHVDAVAQPNAVSLMTPTVGNMDLAFGDINLLTEGGGSQNAHQTLMATLGASKNAWAAVLSPGTLTVQGTTGNDNMSVRRAVNGEISVVVNDQIFWVGAPSRWAQNSLNPYAVAISKVNMFGGEGNDSLGLAGSVVQLFAFGQGGDDLLWGGDAADYLSGGAGNDTITGGAGDDTLLGGANRDILIGGLGADRLQGGAGDDVLIGDVAKIDGDPVKLKKLRDLWFGTPAYVVRSEAAIAFVTGAGFVSDNAADTYLGEGDSDLFFLALGEFADRAVNERSRRI